VSVSGVTSFTQTKNQLVMDAFQLLNLYGIGRTPSTEDITVANSFLNKMLKAWGTKGLHLWCKTEGILYLTPNVSKYYFGNHTTPAYTTLASNSINTQTTSSSALGSTTINVISTSGMSVGNYVGVLQSDKSLFWSTIATIQSSTALTLASGTSQTVNSSAIVYTFTQLISNKPYRVISARLAWGFDSGATSTVTELLMNPLSHADYYALPEKTVGGIPNQYYYDPQLDYGVLNLWARPNDCAYRVHFTYERIIDDMVNTDDNFDLPQEWLEPITWQLAVRLGVAFGKGKRVREDILPLAETMLRDLIEFDSELLSIQFQPDHDGGGVY